MQEIPEWIIKVIEVEKLICRSCKKEFTVENLISIGIQESSKVPNGDVLCIGLFCPNCKELIIFEVKEMTLIDFAFYILDQETSNKIRKKPKKTEKELPIILRSPKKNSHKSIKKSKITLKEIEDIRKFLRPKDLKHEEFLIAMGMLPEEIKKYNYKK